MSAREAIAEAGSITITTLTQALAEAERRAAVAQDELAYLARDGEHPLHRVQQRLDALARELDEATAEMERRSAALHVLREQCERICARLPAIEQMVRSVIEEGGQERRARAVAGAEVEHVRREKLEIEERLRAELALATNENAELRTRLALCEHTLRERDGDVERERELADEAMRCAARVEGELVLGQSAAVAAGPADVAPQPPAVVPISAARRRVPRVRIRHAS